MIENAQMSLALPCLMPGVGGRQAPFPFPPGGGGYQDVCTPSKVEKNDRAKKNGVPRDPRLDELRRMGLQRVWVDVAEQIGVDAFLTAWRIIDADPSCSYDGTVLRVPLRVYRGYLRYQRNRYIETLKASGLAPEEIKRRIERQLGEKVSLRHIQRLAAGG